MKSIRAEIIEEFCWSACEEGIWVSVGEREESSIESLSKYFLIELNDSSDVISCQLCSFCKYLTAESRIGPSYSTNLVIYCSSSSGSASGNFSLNF